MYSRNVPKIRDSRNQAKILTGNPAMRAAYETDANFSIYMHILAIHKLKHMSATNMQASIGICRRAFMPSKTSIACLEVSAFGKYGFN
jgi:hypothetical protein